MQPPPLFQSHVEVAPKIICAKDLELITLGVRYD